MNFITKIEISKTNFPIDYSSKIVLIGSCFVEHIGKKLEYFKFQNLQNPFGILFHPLAIETLITNAINEREYTEEDIFFLNEQWHCFDAHSKLSNVSKEELLKDLNENIKSTHQYIINSTHIIITL
ncbi:MAG TPA: GSCFA domain-containing protein, partial [Flavobacteriaceae bacterium]